MTTRMRPRLHLPALGIATLVVAGPLIGACAPPGEGVPPQITLAAPIAAGSCSAWVGAPVDRTCIPRMAIADAPLVLEIEERCGACGSIGERCSVTLEGRTLTLSLDGKTCEPRAGTSCGDVCGKNRVRCKVPPLPEGRYQVRYGDPGGRVDTLDVTVRDDAARSCMLEDIAGG